MLTDRSRNAVVTCSTLAIAAALAAAPNDARAQVSGSFQGTGTPTTGTASIGTTTGTTNVTITSPQAVIDWTTFDTAISAGTPINFQPAATTANFFFGTGASAVLNRVFPTDQSRPVQFNGTVNSFSGLTSPLPNQGTVFFYSPGGVILGGSAVFNVGNLGLTSASPVITNPGTPGGTFINGNSVTFLPAVSGTRVEIQAGALIDAPNTGSYVAAFAPRVNQFGTIDVNGQAALVAAEAGSITFNPNGLFDIQVTIGSDGVGGVGIDHQGTTTGPAFSGSSDVHRVYLVAVPKNTLLTMAIGGASSLGFDIAGAANVVGNAVVLSAGFDVVAGQADTSAPSAGGGSGQASLGGNPASVTSALSGAATGRAQLFANSGQTANYASDVTLSGTQTSTDPNEIAVQVLSTGTNSQLDIAGNLALTALDPQVVAPASGFVRTRFAVVDATLGGDMAIGGSVTIINDKTATGEGIAATAGEARLAANGGSQLTIGGDVTLQAVGLGSPSSTNGVSTGFGTGGNVVINSIGGATIAIDGNVALNANGLAGPTSASNVDGGIGTGGRVTVSVGGAGSQISIDGNVNAVADGVGGNGSGCSNCGDDGGPGVGGQVFIQAGSGPAQIAIGGNVDLSASGFGGDSLSSLAGAGTGGRANIGVNFNSTISIGGTADVFAFGVGGDDLAASGPGGGGAGTGGLAEFGTFMGGTLTLSSRTAADASGFGGGSSASGTVAGAGAGGIAQFYQDSSGAINVGSDVEFIASGFGGSALAAGAAGGSGTGGQARAISYNAGSSTLNVSGGFNANAQGSGGFGQACAGCTVEGGAGQGGTARIGADAANKTVNIAGSTFVSANGQGGNASGQAAGAGSGGVAQIFSNGSTINFGFGVSLSSDGFGGSHNNGGAGGVGTGGVSTISLSPAGGAINVDGETILFAGGFGGEAIGAAGVGGRGQGGDAGIFVPAGSVSLSGGDVLIDAIATGGFAAAGGFADGGDAEISSDGGSLTIDAPSLTLTASALGGRSTEVGGADGTAEGGEVDLNAFTNGTIAITGDVTLNANGDAFADDGESFAIEGIDGNDGIGGEVAIAQDTGGSVDITGNVTLLAEGFGSNNTGGGDRIAGAGFGGDARIAVNDPGGITIDGIVTIQAQGFGGDGAAATGTSSGGAGTGGLTNVGAVNGGNAISGSARLFSGGFGGEAMVDGAGGAGIGGDALVGVIPGTNGSIAIGGVVELDAGGTGGAGAGAGAGGTGEGGNAQVFAQGGSVTIQNDLIASSFGVGGDAANGAGGGAQGGFANLLAENGSSVSVNGETIALDSGAVGGDSLGAGGGLGVAGESSIFAQSAGSISLSELELDSVGEGGNGLTGGNGVGGDAFVTAQFGSITVSGFTFQDVSAFGGNGSAGGAGGNAFAGGADIAAVNSLGGPSSISLGAVEAFAEGKGGDGGAGVAGGAGGAGGIGQGGRTGAFGTAGNGTLTVGNYFGSSDGRGGLGGVGGTSTSGAGGAGGAGGIGNAGGSNAFPPMSISGSAIGTASGVLDIPSNTGSATFGNVTLSAQAFGGDGGAGGAGTTQGVGGAGGAGFGGAVIVQTRGVPLTVGDASLTASAFGGDGGSGATAGAGGNGYAGKGAVLATQRFMRAERGSLTAGDIAVNLAGVGGSGASAGLGYWSEFPFDPAASDVSGLFVRQADATIASLSITTMGDTAPNYTVNTFAVADNTGAATPVTVTGVARALPISIEQGAVSIGSTLSASTPGNMLLALDAATLTVPTLLLDAGNFVLPATAPATPGTINVSTTLDLRSDFDFLTYANFNVPFDTFFDWNGAFRVGNYTGGGDLFLDAVGPVTIGNLSVGTLDLMSGQGITTGSIVAGGYAEIDAVGAIQTGAVTAAQNAEFESSGGAVTVGNVIAGQGISLEAATTLTAGNLTGGPDPDGLFSIGLIAGSTLTVGNLSGVSGIGMLSATGSITAGNATSGTSLLALARGPVSFGSVTTGSTAADFLYIANASMASLGGPLDDTFNPAPIFAAPPVATTGPIAIAGSVSTGNLIAATTGSIGLGAVNAAGGRVDLSAGTSLLAGAISSSTTQRLIAGTTLTTGNLTAGGAATVPTSVAASAGGLVTTGTIGATRDIVLVSQNAGVTAGNLSTGTSAVVLSRGPVSLASIGTGTSASSFTYIANASMASLGGAIGPNFNATPILAATPQATTGPIAVAGPVGTGNLVAATTGALSIGGSGSVTNITVPGEIELAGNALTLGNLTAGTDIALTSTGAVASGNLTAGDAILVAAAGAVALGNLSAGLVNPSTAADATRGIGVRSSGSNVMVGTVAASRDVGLVAGGGAVTTGTITSDRNILLLARDAVTTGSIAGATAGQIYIASSTISGLAGSLDNISNGIFAATPARLAGAITLGGPVTGGTLQAGAVQRFTAGAMTLGQRIDIDPALVEVNGPWIAPTINIDAQRIVFASDPAAVLGAFGTTQAITLRALASGQTAVLGGSTQGQGFTLTQSDFGRIRTANLTVRVDPQGVGAAAPDLEIRDLTLNGSITSGGGLSSATITTTGRARVTGDLLLQNAGAMDTLAVNGGDRLEIVLPDSSIAITGAGGALAGTLTVSSNNLVAGTLDLLMQVMSDPDGSGLVEQFKAPASTTPNLAGYLRADGVRLLSNANILLQNSGTATDFAGVTVGGGGLIIGRITPATGGTTGGTGGGTTTTSGFSFTGMLVTPNDVLMFQFRVDASSQVTLRTYSYAGGTNQAGQVIPSGGFDPILALFDSAGALLGQNDDGGSNVPPDPTTGARFDTFLQRDLMPGNYTVTVSVFPNFAVGPNLSNGFENDASSFNGRTANFAFDVLGAATATGPGAQQPSGPLNVIGFGRQQTASGATTGFSFFPLVNFGTSGANPLTFSDFSQFNTCLVSGGCPIPTGPTIPEMDPVAAISSEIQLVSQSSLADDPVIEESDEGVAEDETEAESEQNEEDEEDQAASPIAPPAPLVDTRPLNPRIDVVEPVAGAGNPALIGSAVNEGTAQETQP